MPGSLDPAACAATFSPVAGFARAAEVTVVVAGIERTVAFGGVAQAYFPDKTRAELLSLQPGERLGLIWKDAVFLGHDSLLGYLHARLSPGTTSPAGIGSVDSLSEAGGPPATTAGRDFFPAVNRNEFRFEFAVPRFGLLLSSAAPIVNQAEIRELPPIGAVYRLAQPVRFTPDTKRSGRLSLIAPSAEIRACNVRLHVEGGMTLRILGIREEAGLVQIDMEAASETDHAQMSAAWMIWPRPPQEFTHPTGMIEFHRNVPVRFTITAERDMFYEARWIILSLAHPFDASASAAVPMPGLP